MPNPIRPPICIAIHARATASHRWRIEINKLNKYHVEPIKPPASKPIAIIKARKNE